MIHYHIRWADSKLDWEAFNTEKEAREAAECLKRRSEDYAIEKRDGDCQRCSQTKSRILPRGERYWDDLNP